MKSKHTSKELRKRTRKKLKKIGRRNRKFVYLKCNQCGKERQIRTADKSLYTEKIRKKYVCVLCRDKRG